MTGSTPIFDVELILPDGIGLNKEAPSSFSVTSGSTKLAKGKVEGLRTVVNLVKFAEDPGECRLEMKLYLCSKSDGTCFVRNLEAIMAIDLCDGEAADNSVQVILKVP